MFNFDTKRNVLEISKIPYKKNDTVYQISEASQSYDQYKREGLLRDIEELLIPELNNAVGGTEDEPRLWLKKGSGIVRYDTTSTYKGYEYNSAWISLCTPSFPQGTKPFCIFKLPFMDEYGVLNREGKKYALLNELVQDDDITYNDGELKIITKDGCHIKLGKASSGSKVVYRKKKYSSLAVMYALAMAEGLDSYKMFDKLKSKDIINVYKDEEDLEKDIIYETANIIKAGVLKAFTSDAYDLTNVRKKMNKVLSIDRAIGKNMSREITLSNGEVIPAETLITTSLVKKLKYNRINEIYVMNVPNMLGYYIAEEIRVPFLRKGTEMIDIISDVIPNYTGMYLDKNIHLETPLTIDVGVPVTKGLLEMLAYNGIDYVKLKPSQNSIVEVVVPFEIEIIGNRHFRECDIGLSTKQDYVYVGEDGKISPAKQFICAYDMLAIISLFNRLIKNENLEVVSNIDLGLRKKVNQANELFHKAFKSVVREFMVIIKRKFVDMWNMSPQDLNNPDEMEARFFLLAEKWWSTLYTEMKVISQIDMNNPVSYYSSLSKIVTIVKDSNTITGGMREISMGHYGRICPYETPSSKKLGVVGNKAIGCKIINGIMHTAYYRVKHIGNESYITNDIVWLSVEEEEKYRIADIISLDVGSNGKILSKERVLARVPTVSGIEKMSVSHVDISNIDLVNTNPNQTLSQAATTVPFIGSDDAARVTFGLSMCKQAKGLLKPEVPLVLTSAFYDIPRKSPFYMINAEYDGIVEDIVNGRITVYYPELNDVKTYVFEQNEINNVSVIIRSVDVKVGQEVKAGDILVSSNYVKDGLLAIGVNALIAYIPTGYNYEDGVYASDRLRHKLTSYGANIETESMPKKYKVSRVCPINKFRYIRAGQSMYKIRHITASDPITRTINSQKLKGFLVDVNIEVDKFTKQNKATVAKSVSFDYLNSGDKVANRHGNKGVTPELRANTEMARLANGEFVDICYNQAGVSSRMNIGQILECNLGLACLVLGIKARSDSFNGATYKDIKTVLSYAWHLANDDDYKNVNSLFPELPETMKEYCVSNIERIRNWKGTFNEDGTAVLFNPRTGKNYEGSVVLGVNYIYKLVHEVAKKVHARGGLCTEPYVEKADSPTHGSASRGGQRYGSMEIDALSAYGASNLIQELMNERGDNAVARNNITVDALHSGDKYKLDESTAIRRSTEFFLNVMESLGVKIEFEGELPNNTKYENNRRKVFTTHALLNAQDVGGKGEDNGYDIKFNNFSDALGD